MSARALITYRWGEGVSAANGCDHRSVSDTQIPSWGTQARNVFRVLMGLYVTAWLIRGLLELSNLAFDTEFFRGDRPAWASAIMFGFLVAALVAGLVWLAGALVAGYREPK
jgi:hypothetical protein